MDRVLYVVFTHGTSLFSKAIETVEELGEKLYGDNGVEFLPTHTGIIEQGKFCEALASGFVGDNIRYQPENVRIYKLVVTDPEKIAAGDEMFNSLLGTNYSPDALICGAAYTLLHKELPDKENEGDCSEDVTRILRAYGFEIEGAAPCSSVTPNILIGDVDKTGELTTMEEALQNVG
jgi:hypothetical protein